MPTNALQMIDTPEKHTIIVIDDDALIRQSIRDLLFENGFDVLELSGSKGYEEIFSQNKIDLALIDLRLLGESGQVLSQKISSQYNTPIIMISGTGDDIDKIISLETGADDFIMKPFNPREMIARIRALLRRNASQNIMPKSNETQPKTTSSQIAFGDFVVDLKSRCLINMEGGETTLTNSEFKLLEYFILNPNIIIKREVLLQQLGCDTSEYVDRTIDVHILRLRRKIEKTPTKPIHLHTRRGKGYIFVNE